MTLVPEGYFTAVAIPTVAEHDPEPRYARLAYAKNGETRKFISTFVITEGEYAGERLFWDGYLTKDSMKRTCESLRYMGLKGDDLLAAETQELNQTVSLKVEHNEWDGRVSARVAFVNQPGGAKIRVAMPMPMDEKRKFAAMMRESMSRLAEVDGDRAKAPEPAQRLTSPDDDYERPGDDDLPF